MVGLPEDKLNTCACRLRTSTVYLFPSWSLCPTRWLCADTVKNSDVTDEQALYLSDILPTSYWCVLDSGVTKGSTVAVWGGGPIGQCVIRWAKLKGAARVILIDRVPSRLEFAREKSGTFYMIPGVFDLCLT